GRMPTLEPAPGIAPSYLQYPRSASLKMLWGHETGVPDRLRSGDLLLERRPPSTRPVEVCHGRSLQRHQRVHERVPAAKRKGNWISGRHQSDEHPDGACFGRPVHFETHRATAAIDQSDLAGWIGQIRILR